MIRRWIRFASTFASPAENPVWARVPLLCVVFLCGAGGLVIGIAAMLNLNALGESVLSR